MKSNVLNEGNSDCSVTDWRLNVLTRDTWTVAVELLITAGECGFVRCGISVARITNRVTGNSPTIVLEIGLEIYCGAETWVKKLGLSKADLCLPLISVSKALSLMFILHPLPTSSQQKVQHLSIFRRSVKECLQGRLRMWMSARVSRKSLLGWPSKEWFLVFF